MADKEKSRDCCHVRANQEFMHNCQSCLFSLDNEGSFYSSEQVVGKFCFKYSVQWRNLCKPRCTIGQKYTVSS